MVSDGLFMGTALKTETCEGQLVTNIWRVTVEKSTLAFLSSLSYSALVVIVWTFTFMQIIIPVLRTTPRPNKSEQFTDPMGVTSGYEGFENLFGERINSGTALA